MYPYGLNERLDEPYIDAMKYIEKGNCILRLLHKPISHRGLKLSQAGTYQKPKLVNTKHAAMETFNKICQSFQNDDNFRIVIRRLINNLKKDSVFDMVKICIKEINTSRQRGDILMNSILDNCRNYIKKCQNPKNHNTEERYIVLTYSNQNIETLQLRKILND